MAAPSISSSSSPPARRFLNPLTPRTPMPSKAPPPTPATTPPAPRPSVPMLLPVFILFVLLLCFLSIFLLRDLLHFFSLWLRRRRLHAASVDDAIETPTPMPRKPGLDPAILATFPTMPFKAALEGPRAAGSECSVCLSEFADADTVRLLTVCRHAFHAACIDSWLGAHTTCPVCRSDLAAPPDEATVIAIQEAIDGSQECDSWPHFNHI